MEPKILSLVSFIVWYLIQLCIVLIFISNIDSKSQSLQMIYLSWFLFLYLLQLQEIWGEGAEINSSALQTSVASSQARAVCTKMLQTWRQLHQLTARFLNLALSLIQYVEVLGRSDLTLRMLSKPRALFELSDELSKACTLSVSLMLSAESLMSALEVCLSQKEVDWELQTD